LIVVAQNTQLARTQGVRNLQLDKTALLVRKPPRQVQKDKGKRKCSTKLQQKHTFKETK